MVVGGRPQVRVADDGPGIPAEDRQRAVERFVRLDPSRTGKGAGLGLSLVAGVARLHGGTIDLSDAGAGPCAGQVLPGPPPSPGAATGQCESVTWRGRGGREDE